MAFRFVEELTIAGRTITYTTDNAFNECKNYIINNPYSGWNHSSFIDWNVIQYANAPIGYMYQNQQITSTDPMTILPVVVGTGEFTEFGKISGSFKCTFTFSDQSTIGVSGGGQPSSNNAQSFAVLFFVDEEAEELIVGRLYRSNIASFYNFTTNSATAKKAYQELWLGIKPIYHTWRSFPSVTGKNGTFNFTMLKDTVIDDSQAQNLLTPDDFTQVSSQTNAWNLLSGVPYMQEVYPIYAGKVDHMGIRYGLGGVAPDNYIIITVEFFTSASTPFLTHQIQTPKDLSENIYPAFIVDDEKQVARMTLVREYDYAGFKRYNLNFSAMQDSSQLYIWLHSHSEDPDVNEPVPDGEVEPWNDIGITGLTQPSVSAIDTGFTSMFKVSPTELKALAGFLWTDNFVENVAKFFSDPREIIIGLSLLPVEPPTEQTASEIKAGGISTGIFGFKLTSQYDLVEMGSIYIKEEKTAKFLNYPPNTRVIAHLPYVGDHELDVNDVMGKTVTLTYLFDFLNGCCIAELKVEGGDNGTHRYFYSGSCAVQIPTSSEDFGRQYSSILSSGVAFGSVLATPLTGGLSAPMGLGAIGNIISNGMAMSPNADYSSGGGAITGFLSSQTAYLIVILPREKIAGNQDQFIGRPSFMKRTLNDLSGFVKCYNAHLTSLPATGNEKDEIERALKDGVIIETGSPTPTVTPVTTGNIVIAFMKMTSENNVIGKSWTRGTDEDAILKIEGKLLYDQSILTPKILVEGDLRGFNYCYMSLFGRFYYITDIVARNGNLMEVSLKCDPLQSFRTEILACEAIIERTSDSNAINSYFNDNEYWCQMNKQVKFIPFLNGEKEELTIPRNKNSYILTIAGGD